MKKTKGSIKWTGKKTKKYLGKHLIAEFWGGKIIENSRELERILKLAAKKAKSTPLKFISHKFKPQGMSGVLLLAESHIAYHSWPEYNFCAIDIFTCGNNSLPESALNFLKEKLSPEKVEFKEIKRGENYEKIFKESV